MYIFSLSIKSINPMQKYPHIIKSYACQLMYLITNVLRNPPCCSFASFWTVLVTPFNNKPESSRDFTILIISPISSFDIIGVVSLWLEPNIF